MGPLKFQHKRSHLMFHKNLVKTEEHRNLVKTYKTYECKNHNTPSRLISTPCMEKLKHLKNCHCNQTGLINQRTSENIGEKWKHFYSQENDNQFCRSNSYSHWPKKFVFAIPPFSFPEFYNNIGCRYLMGFF